MMVNVGKNGGRWMLDAGRWTLLAVCIFSLGSLEANS